MLELEEMQEHGYLILLKAEVVLRMYEANSHIERYRQEYRKFREVFAQFNPRHYRGISRNPLGAFPMIDERGEEIDDNLTARKRMHDLLSPWLDSKEYDPSRDDDLLRTEEEAISVHTLLDRPADYEIICSKGEILHLLAATWV